MDLILAAVPDWLLRQPRGGFRPKGASGKPGSEQQLAFPMQGGCDSQNQLALAMPQQMSLFSQMAQFMQSLMLQSQGNVTLDNGKTLEINGKRLQVGSAILDKLRQGPANKKIFREESAWASASCQCA